MYGKRRKVIENWSKRHGKLHPSLAGRVRLHSHLSAFWMAYRDLYAERLEAGAIPASAVLAWASIHGWTDRESLRHLYRIVKVLDDVYLEHQSQRPSG